MKAKYFIALYVTALYGSGNGRLDKDGRTILIRNGWIGDSMSSEKSSRSSALLFSLFIVYPRVNTRQAVVL